jgi:hypothetical protein
MILKVPIDGLSDSFEETVTIRLAPVNMLEGSQLGLEHPESFVSLHGFVFPLLIFLVLFNA